MAGTTTVTFKGLREYRAGLKSLSDQQLEVALKPAMKMALNSIVVPKMKSEAKSANRFSPSRSRSRGKRGKKGPLARNITTKLVRKRSLKKHGSLVGYHVAPRAWYGSWVALGTQPHSLLKGAKVAKGVNQTVPSPRPGWQNRWHPGARGNDFVGRAGRASEAAVGTRVHRAVYIHFKRQSKA